MPETATPDVEKQLGSLLDQYQQQFAQIRARGEAITRAQVEEAGRQQEEMAPARQALQQQLQQPAPAPPAAPQLPKSPTIAARPFMEGMPGEQPVQALNRTLMGLGLMAQMAVGIAKNYAQGALHAYNGALRGWAAGDWERGEQEWKTYLGQVDNMQRDYRNRLAQYNATWDQYSADIDRRKVEMLILAGKQQEDRRMLELLARDDERAMKELQMSGVLLEKLFRDTQHLNMQKWMMEFKREQDREHQEYQRGTLLLLQKARENAGGGAPGAPGSDFTPEARDMAARSYLQTGQLPPMGLSKRGAQLRVEIINRATELATQEGLGPENQAQRQALYKANQSELNQLQGQRGKILAFARTAESNLGIAEKLSAEVDRTGQPVFNRWLLAGRKSVEGDVGVVKFDAAVRTAINEYAKVTSSATGGGVTSDTARKEVESMLNTAQTPQQFAGVVSVLRQELGNRQRGYDEQIDAIRRSMQLGKQGAGGKTLSAEDYAEARKRGYTDEQIRAKGYEIAK